MSGGTPGCANCRRRRPTGRRSRQSRRASSIRSCRARRCQASSPLLDALRARGIATAIASSAPSRWVVPAAIGIGVADRFQAIVAGDQVARRKPAADVYVEALRRLRVDPRRSVAIEDSAPGLVSARAAGVKTVVVPHWLTSGHDLWPPISAWPTPASSRLTCWSGWSHEDAAGRCRLRHAPIRVATQASLGPCDSAGRLQRASPVPPADRPDHQRRNNLTRRCARIKMVGDGRRAHHRAGGAGRLHSRDRRRGPRGWHDMADVWRRDFLRSRTAICTSATRNRSA